MSQASLETRIQAGAREAGVAIDASQVQQLTQYLAHLERWNRTINLTALPLSGYPAATLDRLIFEPLRSVQVFGSGRVWIDLGSGGGSPAIPLKILLPEADLTMVESRSRKAAFLRDVVRVVGLSHVRVLWERVEALEPLVPSASIDVLTIRALRLDAGVAKAADYLLNASGRVVSFGPVDAGPLLAGFEAVNTGSARGDIQLFRRRTPGRLFHVEH